MIAQTLAFVHACGRDVFGEFWFFVWAMVKLGCVMGGVLFMVAYLTLWERKMIGWMHVRVGPNRTGPLGLLQPVADGLKLLFKEIVIPEKADKKLFCLAPVLAMTPALAAWAVMPFGPEMALANLDAGILFFMTMTSVGVYGIIIAGWASNSRYAFLGAMRAAAQMISFGVPMGFVLVTVLMVSGSANLTEIVAVQGRGFFAGHGLNFLSWNWIPLLPLCFIFVVCSLAETGRHPFDAPEGESEIVAGHMVEYSGMAFGMFFMAEYANMILFSTMTVILFMGGWLPPTDWSALAWVPGWIWLGAKTFFVVSAFIWIRGTFPRYRYDHTMRLGWKIFLPITLACLVGVACWMRTPWNIWV